jgi:hypothetical protein
MTDARGLTIGKLATRGWVNTQTIRYYERRGLITESTKMCGLLARFAAACTEEGPPKSH